jgi:hypothetical protein
MDNVRGRPLACVFILVTSWVTGRALLLENIGPYPAKREPAMASQLRNANSQPLPHAIRITARPHKSGSTVPNLKRTTPYFTYSVTPVARPWAAGGQPSGFPTPLRVAAADNPVSKRGTTPLTLVPERKAGAFSLARQEQDDWPKPKRATVYAYSFWRSAIAGSATGLAPAAQYGGSQSGLIATWDPLGAAGSGPALLARAAATPDGREREWALGTRWQPDHRIPVSLSVERRIRHGQSDAVAAYLAGGLNEQVLRGKVKIDAFGQMGVLRRDAPGAGRTIEFYDSHIRATHTVLSIGKMPVALGVGGWSGGQSGVARLDTGPTASTQFSAGPVTVHLQMDWRFGVAGNARPRDGFAFTLSTGF